MTARLQAIPALHKWLKGGGPTPRGTPVDPEAPPLLHISPHFAFGGSENNVTLIATKRVEAGHFILGVAASSCLHARNDAVSQARRACVEKAAAAVRAAAKWKTSLVHAADAGRLECIVLLTLELLDGKESTWWPYICTLPEPAYAAPPSLWSSLLGEHAAQALLADTSIGSLIAQDQQDLLSSLGQGLVPEAEAAVLPTADAAAATADAAADALQLAQLLGVAASEAEVRTAFLRAVGLVVTRLVSGVGLAPLFDLMNGAPTGAHNATIEKSNLAASATAKDQAPCVAAISSRAIEEGEEVL